MLASCRVFLALSVAALQVRYGYAQSSTTYVTGISPSSITVSFATDITFTVSGAPAGVNDAVGFQATSCSGTPTTLLSSCTTVVLNSQYKCSITEAATGTGLKVCYLANGNTVSDQTGLTLDVVAATESDYIQSATPSGIYVNVATAVQTNTKTTHGGGGKIGFEPSPSGTCDASTTSLTALASGTNPTTTFTIGTVGLKKICFRAPGGSDLIEQTGVTIMVSAAGGTGADPVAWAGDTVRVFELPVGTLVPLLQTTDMTLRGETFSHGGPWQQWFGRMVLSSPDRSHWVQITMKKDILDFNRSRAPKGHFETMDVSMGIGPVHDSPLESKIYDVATKIPRNFLGFNVEFWKMDRNAQAAHTKIGAARRECMEVAGANTHFFVCSSPAHEFYGWQHNLSIQNAHLDLVIAQIHNGQELRGLLPELWGMQPLSEETKKVIVHDSSNDTSSSNLSTNAGGLEVPKLPEAKLPTGQAWAGGFGHDELLHSCKVGNDTVLGCKSRSGGETSKTLTI